MLLFTQEANEIDSSYIGHRLRKLFQMVSYMLQSTACKYCSTIICAVPQTKSNFRKMCPKISNAYQSYTQLPPYRWLPTTDTTTINLPAGTMASPGLSSSMLCCALFPCTRYIYGRQINFFYPCGVAFVVFQLSIYIFTWYNTKIIRQSCKVNAYSW